MTDLLIFQERPVRRRYGRSRRTARRVASSGHHKALGYVSPANAITAHCKGHRFNGPSAGGMQNTKFIPEGDVYRPDNAQQAPGGGAVRALGI